MEEADKKLNDNINNNNSNNNNNNTLPGIIDPLVDTFNAEANKRLKAALRDQKIRLRRQKIANCCRETTAFLFSHVGLSAMIVAYTVLGAFTFRQIESESERMEKFHIIKLKDDLVGEILNLTESFNCFPPQRRKKGGRFQRAADWSGGNHVQNSNHANKIDNLDVIALRMRRSEDGTVDNSRKNFAHGGVNSNASATGLNTSNTFNNKTIIINNNNTTLDNISSPIFSSSNNHNNNVNIKASELTTNQQPADTTEATTTNINKTTTSTLKTTTTTSTTTTTNINNNKTTTTTTTSSTTTSSTTTEKRRITITTTTTTFNTSTTINATASTTPTKNATNATTTTSKNITTTTSTNNTATNTLPATKKSRKTWIHPNKKLLNETLRKIFLDFQTELYKAVKDKGWNGLDEVDETSLQWSLAGSILYAITVITTIGYGHVVPKTDIGRIVTILYALVGIPLTFLYLSNIGNFLADCFRIFYKNICCDVFCCKKCERQRKKERLILRKKREKLIRKKLVAEAAKQTVLISCNKKKNRNYAKLRSVVGLTLGRDLSTDLSSSGKVAGVDGKDDKSKFTMNSVKNSDENITARTMMIAKKDEDDGSNAIEKFEKRAQLMKMMAGEGVGGEEMVEVKRRQSEASPTANHHHHRTFITSFSSQALSRPPPNYFPHIAKTKKFISLNDSKNIISKESAKPCQRRILFKNYTHSSPELALQSPPPPQLPLPHDLVFNVSPILERNEKVNGDEDDDDDDDTLNEESQAFDREVSIKKRNKSTRELKTKSRQASKKIKFLQHVSSSTSENVANNADSFVHPRHPASSPNFQMRRRKNQKLQKKSDAKSKPNKKSLRNFSNDVHYFVHKSSKSSKTDDSDDLLQMTPSLLRKCFDNALAETSILSDEADDVDDENVHAGTDAVRDNSPHRRNVQQSRVAPPENNPTSPKNLKVESATCLVRDRENHCLIELDERNPHHLPNDFYVHYTRNQQAQKPYVRIKSTSENSKLRLGIGRSDEREATSDLKHACSSSPSREKFQLPERRRPSQPRSPQWRRIRSENYKNRTRRNCPTTTTTKPTLPTSRSFDFGHAIATTTAVALAAKEDFSSDDDEKSDDERLNQEETCEHATVTVPIYICLILIGSYLFIGSALFSFWEGWNTITGSYFCFVTLSTIGFGDIVPGTEAKDWSSQPKLVLCAIWLAFGLSLLAMCFNLMQEEVKEKFKRIGFKLGLLKNEKIT